MNYAKEPQKDPIFCAGIKLDLENKQPYVKQQIVLSSGIQKKTVLDLKQNPKQPVVTTNPVEPLRTTSTYYEEREEILSNIRYFEFYGNAAKIVAGGFTLLTIAGMICLVHPNFMMQMLGKCTTAVGIWGITASGLLVGYNSLKKEEEEEALKCLRR